VRVFVNFDDKEGLAGRVSAVRILDDDLRRAGIPSEQVAESAPQESKSGLGASVAELLVSGVLSTASIGAFARIVIAFVNRGAGRKVILEDGGERLELDAQPTREQRRLIELWLHARSASSNAEPEAPTVK